MKRKHPDAVLLFRVGDFYETFGEDAIIVSEILGLTLIRRANGRASTVELAGFPHHALDTYLPRLVRAGKRVAICEQLEDPKLTKKIAKRDIADAMSMEGVILFLKALKEIINNLHLLAGIRHHTKEIRRISKDLGITPISAFTGCFVSDYPTLFDS